MRLLEARKIKIYDIDKNIKHKHFCVFFLFKSYKMIFFRHDIIKKINNILIILFIFKHEIIKSKQYAC